MLCEAAQHVPCTSNPLNSFLAKMATKRGHKLAVMAVAHRILRVTWAILKNGLDFEPEKIGIQEGPFMTRRIRRYLLSTTASNFVENLERGSGRDLQAA